MVRGINDVIDIFRRAAMPHWKMYEGFDTKPTNLILGSGGDQSNSDIEAAVKDVTDLLNKLQPGKYTLAVRTKYNEAATGNNIKFEIPYANGMVPYTNAAIGNVGAVPPGFIPRAEMELEIVKIKNEVAIESLKRDFEEFKKKKEPKDDAVGKFFTTYMPTILGVVAHRMGIANPGAQVGLQGFTGAQQQPPTGNETTTTNTPSTADEKMEWVVNTLAAKEGSPEAAAELLYRFVHYTQQNPQQYEMFKPMILQTEPKHE